MSSPPPPESDVAAFERAARRKDAGVIREMWQFLRERKKWWLAPILFALLFIGLLMALGSSAIGPVIYTLF
jgi:hypothetical protein